jgi:hypothetical protein
MSTATETNSMSAMLLRTLDLSELSPEAIGFLLSLNLSALDRARMSELTEKLNQGTASDSEVREADEYRRFCRMMDVLQLRARIAQQRQANH